MSVLHSQCNLTQTPALSLGMIKTVSWITHPQEVTAAHSFILHHSEFIKFSRYPTVHLITMLIRGAFRRESVGGKRDAVGESQGLEICSQTEQETAGKKRPFVPVPLLV